jgi:hypothetical protein
VYGISKLPRVAALTLCLYSLPFDSAQAALLDSGYWIVLGSIAALDNNFTPRVEAEVGRIELAARRCGLQPFQDFSSKFRGFSPGYSVVVVGAYNSRLEAERVLLQARRCLPEAYIRRGAYAGE